jgi:uncharacterized protein YjbJ (UPF0337 family)
LANIHTLVYLGGGTGGSHARSVETMERWGIALGNALQDEEGKAEELRAETERLRAIIEEKDREIQDLEGGL